MPKNYTVTWTPPASDGGSPITGHDVGYTPAGGSETVEATGSTAASHIITGLTDGTEYSVRVRAENGVGKGPWSDAVTQIAAQPPAQVTGLAVDATGDGTLDLSWSAPASDAAITDYSVEYTPSGGSATTVLVGSETTSYQLTSLTNDTEYSVRVAAVSAAGTGAYSATVTGTPSGVALPSGTAWSQQGSDISGSGGLFGWRTALSSSGSIMAASAFENDASSTNKGAVHVFEYDGVSWSQLGSPIYGDQANDYAGYDCDVSSDGHTVAFGAITTSGTAAGYAKVLTWDGSTWNIKGSRLNGSGSERVGYRVRLSADGDTLAICSQGAAFARVYDWDGSAWSQRGSDITTETSQDCTGLDMTADGNTIVLGEFNNDGTAVDAGSVRVFDWDGIAWAQRGGDLDGDAAGDRFGEEVAVSSDGSVLAVASARNNAGYVRVFSWSGSAWSQMGSDITGDASGDRFGLGLAISGTGLVVAAAADENGGTKTGYAKVFGWDGAAWSQMGSRLNGDAAQAQARNVGLNSTGSVLAHGHHRYASLAGMVRVHEFV